jgi:Na+/melibiose symporter-like transporter
VKGIDGRRPLSLPAALAFAAPSIPIAALQLALTVHLPRYFASHMGLSLAAVGAAFALVRAIDIPLDPLIGLAIDRTRTRFGRYRPWALAAPPVLMIALYALMHPPAAAVSQAYLVAALLVMYLGYSTMFLTQLAWAGGLAPTYSERSRLFALIIGLGVVGGVAVLLAPLLMQKLGYSDPLCVRAMTWFVIVTAPVAALLMVVSAPERIAPEPARGFRLADYAGLLKRPNVARLLASDLLIQLGPGWMAALYLFYFTTRRGFSGGQANLLLLIYLAAGFIGAPLASWLAARLNKHRALMACTSAYALCLLALPALPVGEVAPAVVFMTIAGAMFTGFVVLLRALAADIADEARLDIGREVMGLVFALVNATTKLATAFAIFLTFQTLARVGFDPREGADNTEAALRGLEIAFLAGPTVFVMLGGLCFAGYRLDGARHAEIRRQLDARDGQATIELATLSPPRR